MPNPEPLVRRLLAGGPTSAATHTMLELLSQPAFSRLVGYLAQADVPKWLLQAVIARYVSIYNVDLADMRDPLDSFTSFDEFFGRLLKPGARPIDPRDHIVVSPVDGTVLNVGRVSDGQIDQVKGKSYSLSELLGSEADAAPFAEGYYTTIYLSPRDYHRIHSPVDGKITRYHYIPGRLFPVNRLGVGNIERLFAVNERLTSYVEGSLGEFAVVKVGATNVGMISVSYHDIRTNTGRRTTYDEKLKRKVAIGRGEELGRFHLGSTVVLISSRPDVKPLPHVSPEQTVRMGEALFAAAG